MPEVLPRGEVPQAVALVEPAREAEPATRCAVAGVSFSYALATCPVFKLVNTIDEKINQPKR
jgi:hypothetical protein